MPMPKPYLIQRIIRRDSKDKRGVDSKFKFDYMGSSEFEYGALGKALKEMRKAVSPKFKPIKTWHLIQRSLWTYVKNPPPPAAWYVGPYEESHPGIFDTAREFFTDQLLPSPTHRTMERTYLSEFMADSLSRIPVICGWWCIDEGLPFVLFKEYKHAEEWMYCLFPPVSAPKDAA